MRDAIRKWLGLDAIASDAADIKQSLTALRDEGEAICRFAESAADSGIRLRKTLAEKWTEKNPASFEAIDAIFKENRDRLDMVMLAVDRLSSILGRQGRN